MKSGKRNFLQGLLIVFSALFAGGSVADDWELFTVHDARADVVDEVYVVDANVALHLSRYTREALQSGVPLVIVFQVQVLRQRPWLWKETVANIEKAFRINFHALSERYVIKNLDTGASSSYTSLEEALFNLGTIRELPVITQQRVVAGQKYEIRLRAAIVKEALPAPVRLWSYVSSKWRFTRNWYVWPLNP